MRIFKVLLVLMFSASLALAGDYKKTKVAVLDFQQHGLFSTQDVGKIVAEWFTTSLVDAGRFEVVERRLMQQIIQEQKMGASGLLDPSSASKLGRILGVKTVVTGTVQYYDRTYELNVRLIDVETGSIITADHARAGSTISLNDLVGKVSSRIIQHFPLDGYVVQRSGDKLMLDLGNHAGVKVGSVFDIYVEGPSVRHPKTGEVLSVERISKGTLKIIEVRQKTSTGLIVKEVCDGCIKEGQQVSSAVLFEQETPEQAEKRKKEERKREAEERDEQEKREKEARERQKQLDKESREREKDRLRLLEKEGASVAKTAVAGLVPVTAFPVQREDIQSLAVSASGSLLATSDKSGVIVLWNLDRGTQAFTLPGHLKGDVTALDFSRDGRFLASGGKDRKVVVWDIVKQRQIASLAVKDDVSDLEFSQNGRFIVIGIKSKESLIWDYKSSSAKPRNLRTEDDVLAVAINSDSRYVATGGEDKVIRIWDASSGRLLRVMTGHDGDVRMLAFAGTGGQLVSAAGDKQLLLWDSTSGVLQKRFSGHHDEAVHLAISRDGKRLVSGERKKNGILVLWDTGRGQELKRYRTDKRVDLMGMTPDGRLLVISSGREITTYRIQ